MQQELRKNKQCLLRISESVAPFVIETILKIEIKIKFKKFLQQQKKDQIKFGFTFGKTEKLLRCKHTGREYIIIAVQIS